MPLLHHQQLVDLSTQALQRELRVDLSLDAHLDDLGLAESRLKHAALDAVADAARLEIQARVRQLDLLRAGLRRVVVGPELGHQLGCVLGRIHRQCLGDYQQRVRKLRNGQLFPGPKGSGKVLQVDRQACLHSPSTCIATGSVSMLQSILHELFPSAAGINCLVCRDAG